MKTFKFAMLACLALASLTASVSGQSATWKGFYFGASVGGGLGRSSANTTTVFSPTGYFATTSVPAIAVVGAQHPNLNGLGGGVQIGYNFQKGKIVYGFEADIGATTAGGSVSGTEVYPCCPPTTFTVTQTVEHRWLLAARPHVGLSRGKGLYYIMAGLAVTDLSYQELFTDTFATALETASFDRLKAGWTAGAGIEYRWRRGWSFKGEYCYTDFGQVTVTSNNFTAFTPPISFPTNVFTHRADIRTHSVRLGVNYRF